MATPAEPATLQNTVVKVGRLLLKLVAERAHVSVTITVQDGNIRLVRVDRAYLPENLPDV